MNGRIVKIEFVNKGEEIELPDLSESEQNLQQHIDLLAIMGSAEEHMAELGYTENKNGRSRSYNMIIALQMNLNTVKYVLKKIDPNVTSKQIEEYAFKNKKWLGELMLKMYPEDKKKDFQKAEKNSAKKKKKEPSKKE